MHACPPPPPVSRLPVLLSVQHIDGERQHTLTVQAGKTGEGEVVEDEMGSACPKSSLHHHQWQVAQEGGMGNRYGTWGHVGGRWEGHTQGGGWGCREGMVVGYGTMEYAHPQRQVAGRHACAVSAKLS